MNTLSFAEARSGLKKVMDGVCKNHEPTAVALASGDHVVILSLQDYNSMQETMHLLGSAKNAARLMESIDQLRTGNAKPRALNTSGCATEPV